MQPQRRTRRKPAAGAYLSPNSLDDTGFTTINLQSFETRLLAPELFLPRS